MKFSKKKKAKMRRSNQRRINRECKDMIGCRIDFEHGGYKVKDQAKINDVIYLLVQVEDSKYAIYKIVKVRQYVRLSPNKVLYNKDAFSNFANWRNHSTIQITEEGEIESVKRTVRDIIFKNGKPTYIYVVEG